MCRGAEESAQPASVQDVAGQNASSCAHVSHTHHGADLLLLLLLQQVAPCVGGDRRSNTAGLCLSQNDLDRCLEKLEEGPQARE